MGVILSIVGLIALPLFVRWLCVEIGVQHMPLCRWLLKIAAAHLPIEERAAIESEWLAVIEDMRSPTRQLLHSLSYALSALRIRQAIAPEARMSHYVKVIFSAQLLVNGAVCGCVSYAFLTRGEQLIGTVLPHVTKMTVIAVIFIVALALGAASYTHYRVCLWYFNRRERRRLN